MSLNGKEADVVGTPIFQRLRRIRQLAFAHLVYPGALHTRFEHSLGVCHITGLLARRLNLGEETVQLARLTALLHDLGHGPFSHVSEYALAMYADRKQLGEPIKREGEIHELVTVDIIRSDHQLRSRLGDRDCGKVADLLSEGFDEPVLRSLISGPLDGDKQDYLLRDSYFCGVKYGLFDMDQLHRELRSFEDPADQSLQLAISDNGIHALEQFVMAKYYMTTQVYAHKVRLITDQMLLRAITVGIEEDHIEEMRQLYTYDGSPDFAERYAKWDDEVFMSTFCDDSKFRGKKFQRILSRLRERRLLKRVYRRRLSELPEVCRNPLSSISEVGKKDRRDELEAAVHDRISGEFPKILPEDPSEPPLVIVHSYTVKSVREQYTQSEGQIPVISPSGPKTFDQESLLFRSIDDTLSEGFVEVYAPVDYPTRADKKKLLRRLDDEITAVFDQFFATEERENENS